MLVVAVSTVHGERGIEELVADAEAGHGLRKLAERAERARGSLGRNVAPLLEDPAALDRLQDAQIVEIARIKHERGPSAAAAAVETITGGDEPGRRATPLAAVVATLEREGMPATLVCRWLDTGHEDLDDRHADPPATPAEAIDAGRAEEVAGLVDRMVETGTVPGPWTTCMACMGPARWSRTGGQGDVDIVCDAHREELGDRDADPWQPERGYNGRQGNAS